jgi:hypothetical protein
VARELLPALHTTPPALEYWARSTTICDVDTFAIDAFAFSTFFGGSDPSWAPQQDEHISFDLFVITTARG